MCAQSLDRHAKNAVVLTLNDVKEADNRQGGGGGKGGCVFMSLSVAFKTENIWFAMYPVQYYDAVRRMFEKHKHEAGYGDWELVLMR